MATTVYARVDVSVSPYLTIDAPVGTNQPAITSGLTSATFPTGYFGGGSFLGTIDNDNNVECLVGGVVCLSGDGALGAIKQILNDAASGVLILRHSGFEEATKETEANAEADIMIHATNSNSTGKIVKLSVENKDVFVIPYTGQAANGYYAVNQFQTVSKPAYLEYCFINNEE